MPGMDSKPVSNLLKKSQASENQEGLALVYLFDGFRLDSTSRVLSRGEESLPITAKVFDVLLVLVKNHGRLVEKDEFLREVWPDTVVEESNLSQSIFTLRKLLGEKPNDHRYIVTLPGRGYQFVAPVSVSPAPHSTAVRQRTWLRVPPRIGVLVLAAAGLGAMLFSMTSQPRSNFRFTPFVTDAELASAPVWSPDGKTIAYEAVVKEQPALFGVSNGIPSGIKQIYTRGIQSTAAVQVTHEAGNCHRPFWSPDGKHVYYRSQGKLLRVSAGGGASELVLANLDFGVVINDISPDGRAIAVAHGQNGTRQEPFLTLWTSSPPGSALQRYPLPIPGIGRAWAQEPGPGTAMGDVQFAPDSSKLLYIVHDKDGLLQFWILPWPGTGTDRKPRRVFESVRSSKGGYARWFPDSRRVVMSLADLDHLATNRLWIGDTASNQIHRLTQTNTAEHYPAVSPDGRRIVYRESREDTDLIEVPVDGSLPRRLLVTSQREEDPVWCGNSGQFLYRTDRSGHPELWLGSATQGWQRPIVTDKEFSEGQTLSFGPPTCSPANDRIVYRRSSSSGVAVWMSSIAGGVPQKLFSAESLRTPLTWSPDGEWLAYGAVEHGSSMLIKVRVGVHQTAVVIRTTETEYAGGYSPRKDGVAPAWSPTGEWITIQTPEWFGVVSPDGRQAKKLTGRRSVGQRSGHAWSEDGSLIYLACQEDERTVIYAINVLLGTERKIADLGSAVLGATTTQNHRLSFSAERKSLTSTVSHTNWSLWLLDGFERGQEWWAPLRFWQR